MDDDEVLRAVSDFMRVEINRGKWIETEIIDEDAASDFEEKLNNYWRNQKRRINIVSSGLSEEKRGQLMKHPLLRTYIHYTAYKQLSKLRVVE